MIPDVASHTIRHAEGKLYEALRVLSDDYRVYHSLAYRLAHRAADEGEIDILLVHPERGLLVIEVKGGQIAYDGRARQWSSRDAGGVNNPIQDPFEQAQDQIKSLVREIAERRPFGDTMPAYTHGHAVAFPDCEYRPANVPISAPKELVIDASDLSSGLASRIESLYDAWKRPGSEPLGKRGVKQLGQQILAPHFELTLPLATRIAWDEKALRPLSEEQLLCLDFLELNPRSHVQGPAGTGKTVVACEFARRLAAKGARVLLVCFNLPLAHRLREHVAGYEGLPGSIWAGAYHELCREWAERAGVDLRDSDDVPQAELGSYWNEETSVRLLEAAEKSPDRFDALIVDEAQDFMTDWWEALGSVLRDASTSPIVLLSDPAQDLFDRKSKPPWPLTTFPLRTNHRSSQSISRFAAEAGMVDIRQSATMPAGDEVSTTLCASQEDQLGKVAGKIHWLRTQGIAPDAIAIVGTYRFENSCFATSPVLDGLAIGPVQDDGSTPPGIDLRYATPARLKGLEADVVIACDMDPGDSPRARRNLYVAASRAKHRLYVYSVDQAAKGARAT
jgi:hypothetical protein